MHTSHFSLHFLFVCSSSIKEDLQLNCAKSTSCSVSKQNVTLKLYSPTYGTGSSRTDHSLTMKRTSLIYSWPGQVITLQKMGTQPIASHAGQQNPIQIH